MDAAAYPRAWHAPVNPLGARAAEAARVTLREAGVLGDRRADRVFAATAPALLGALPFPLADEATLGVVTTFLANWALYDDAIETTGEPDVRRVTRAVCGELFPDADLPPAVRGFAMVGAALGDRSDTWRRTFGARFAATTRSVDTERALRARCATPNPPSVAEYLAWRRVNIGLLPVLSLVEVDLGRELPRRFRADPLLATLEEAASEVVLAVNDLHGVHRDDGLNLVDILAREAALPPAAARARVQAFHDAAVARMLDLEAALRARHDGALEAWLHRVHHVLTGFAAWHAAAPRYRATGTPASAAA